MRHTQLKLQLLLSALLSVNLVQADTCNQINTNPSNAAISSFADDFSTQTFNGNTGTQRWKTSWQEINDDNSPNTGKIRIKKDKNSLRLRIKGNKTSNKSMGIWRSADTKKLASNGQVTLDFDYRRAKIKKSSASIRIEVSTDGGNTWTEVGRISGPAKDKTYLHARYDLSGFISNDTRIRFMNSTDFNKEKKVYIDNIRLEVTNSAQCPSETTTDHFTIRHDGQGIHCLSEPVSVQASLANGQADTAYTGQITLDTGTGTGDWTLASGKGQFSDPVPGDGLARYQFTTADQGMARFALSYRSGPAAINIGISDNNIRNDNSAGQLTFSPSGFTITHTPLSNPPPRNINTAIPVQTAAQGFTLYLTAYGQTANDASCGVIESYHGPQNLQIWSQYIDPASGTRPVQINASSVAGTETNATVRRLVFNQGMASINADYADAGAIQIHLKDTGTNDPSLPAGIRGSSQTIVVKPANFTLSNIRRSSDGRANPAATSVTGPVFMAAGAPFSVTVTARNAQGASTPNFGQETSPETVKLTPAIVASGGQHNPDIHYIRGFNGQFSSGSATGSDFDWPEVGIITLTAHIGDGDYLGGGDVSGSPSMPIGRFIPYDFAVQQTTTPRLHTQCSTFSYLEQRIAYASPPAISMTARSMAGQTTRNYQGPWWKLAGLTETYTHNGAISQGALLDATALNHSTIACPACAGTTSSQFGGTLRYTRSQAETDPFISALNIQFSITDTDGAAYPGNPYQIHAIRFDQGAEFRSGRGGARDIYGTYARINDTLTLTTSSQYYDALSGGWIDNTADSCSTISYQKTDTDITTTLTPVSPATLNTGKVDLTLTLTADAGKPGGSSRVNLGWPAWLPGPASVTATFGLFRGDDRRLNWRESH